MNQIYESMVPKQINISEERVSQVTEVIEQEHENPFGIHVDKEKLINTSPGVALDDNTALQKVCLIWLM